jgi:hypothetical protein
MNNDRRKQIAAIVERLGELEVLVGEIMNDIMEVEQDEQDYLDNMPDSLRQGDKGSRAEDAVMHLGDASSALDDISVSDIISCLENAAE